ncbi:MAG: hypothetical protein Hyperionvirus3_58 [Hyperionvirus sp.]|uniref:Uncharacterized protein n=1 Tax=Hyperionvirus sp. TaxID=2487770 RepID=A0A3G5A794_9VIRU|nr:MAG: hypothetical protein Hyperionvirus3_58 [Hyperionvirus sp.]
MERPFVDRRSHCSRDDSLDYNDSYILVNESKFDDVIPDYQDNIQRECGCGCQSINSLGFVTSNLGAFQIEFEGIEQTIGHGDPIKIANVYSGGNFVSIVNGFLVFNEDYASLLIEWVLLDVEAFERTKLIHVARIRNGKVIEITNRIATDDREITFYAGNSENPRIPIIKGDIIYAFNDGPIFTLRKDPYEQVAIHGYIHF